MTGRLVLKIRHLKIMEFGFLIQQNRAVHLIKMELVQRR